MREKVRKSLDRLCAWVEAHGYKAYDPGDGQLSYLRHLTFGQQWPRRVLTAVVLRAPFNVRPLLGIPPHTSTKGMGYMAWGYLKRYQLTREERFVERARHCLDWLISHRSDKYPHYCWGNEFAFSTRAGTILPHEPTIVWSSLIAHAFLDANHILGDGRYLEVAGSVAEWILTLPREKTASGDCLSYVAFKQSSVHNSNLLGGSVLARVGARQANAAMLDTARQAMLYSCSRQNGDGAWYYGEDPKYHWIDSFHTGYNLDCLQRYTEATGDRQFEPCVRRGYEYFKNHFFEPDGRPKYYHDRTYPLDIQCASQAIDTLTLFSGQDPAGLDLAVRVADWTVDRMQDQDGHFYYRDLGWTVNRTPMLHWGQGTMFKALAHLENVLASRHSPEPAGRPLSVSH